jgi:hypothetical protein
VNANRRRHRSESPLPEQANDDVLTVVAISLVAEMLGDVLHEG